MNSISDQTSVLSTEAYEDSSPESSTYDQTLFAEDVLFTDLHARAEDPVTPTGSKRKVVLLIALGFFASAIFAGSIYLQLRREQAENRLLVEESAAQQQPQGIPALERQLSLLRNDIETADPLESPLAFPPLDFRLNLQDATSLLIEQQTR